jgi:Flp pilus assembly protein TadD
VGATIAKYISWMILPIHMSIERSTETPSNDISFGNLVALGALFLVVLVIIYLRRKMPELSGGLAWMLLALLPFSGFVFVYQGMAERYTYIASMGLAVSLVSLALTSSPKIKYAVFTLLGFWVLWGVWRLNSRLLDWRDDLSLYSSSLKTDPDSPVLLVNLGSTLSDAGHNADALVLLNRAVSLKPDYQLAYRDMGNAYLRLGMYDPARSSYQKAVDLQPGDVQAITNLGTAYVRLGNLAAAEREFRRAIALSPTTVGPYCDLGVVLFYRGKLAEALQQLRSAMKLNPSDPSPYYFLGFIEEQMGARDAARQLYEKALQIEPGYAPARAGLSRLEHHPD